ncbi:MAG: AsmA family protein [Syntrophobacteraceae bacterium]
MGKGVRIVFAVVVVCLLLLGAVVGYVVATFDPGQYKHHVINAVKEATHRTLKLEGEIHLSVFPHLALSVSRASLSEPNSDQIFMQAEAVRAAVRLLPLLSKRVEIKRIELKGVVAHVVRSKEGKLNFEDIVGAGATKPAKKAEPPPGSEGKPAPTQPAQTPPSAAAVEIVALELDGATIDYLDEAESKRYVLSNVQIRTGRIADGAPGSIQVAFAVKADQPALDVHVTGKTGFLFQAEKQQVRLNGLDLTVKGSCPGVSGIDAVARGDVDVSGATSEILISKLDITASGKQSDGEFKLKLDVPRLAVTRDKLSGETVRLDMTLKDAKQTTVAQVKIPGIEGTRQTFAIGPLEATVNVEGSGRTIKASLVSKVTGNAEARQVEVPQIALTVSVVDPSLPKSPVDAKVEGSARLDLATEDLTAQFVTQLDESRIDGKAGVTRFSQPIFTFDLGIDQLDADRYLAKPEARKAEGAGQEAKPAQAAEKAAEKPMDLSGLKSVTASGALRVGRLKVANMRASQVRAEIKLANGRLDVSPLSASLYDGSLSGAFSAQSASTPVFALKQQLSGVNVGAFLKDAANSEKLEGKGTFSLDVTTQGANAAALKKGLNGAGSLSIVDGAIKGIDLAATIREAKDKLRELRGKKTQGEDKSKKTAFTELRATFTIKNGVAHNSDLAMKSPLLRVAGEGDIDIGNDRLDYLVKSTLVGTTKGQGGREASDLAGITIPVRITGPLKEPQYTLDTSGLVEELGKGLLDKAKESLKGEKGSGQKVEDRLKGLLGR